MYQPPQIAPASSLLAQRRYLLHTLYFRDILSYNLPANKIYARACKVLPAIDDPLEEGDCDDDGECDDAVVYACELVNLGISTLYQIRI